MPLGPQRGPVAISQGPYILTGAWWRRELRRDYYFVELRSGDLLWIYYDARRRGYAIAMGRVSASGSIAELTGSGALQSSFLGSHQTKKTA